MIDGKVYTPIKIVNSQFRMICSQLLTLQSFFESLDALEIQLLYLFYRTLEEWLIGL